MTPAEQLAAVVAKWRRYYEDGNAFADDVQPILAELQRVQRLTEEQVRQCLPCSSSTQSDTEWWKVVTANFNALLSAPTTEERAQGRLTDKWLLKLLLRISTDCAQTALEDPIKYGDGWVLHSKPVLEDIAEAARMATALLSAPTPEETK